MTSVVTAFIGLTYEGISSYLHNQNQKTLQKHLMLWKEKYT